jgi:hypothetical protein
MPTVPAVPFPDPETPLVRPAPPLTLLDPEAPSPGEGEDPDEEQPNASKTTAGTAKNEVRGNCMRSWSLAEARTSQKWRRAHKMPNGTRILLSVCVALCFLSTGFDAGGEFVGGSSGSFRT